YNPLKSSLKNPKSITTPFDRLISQSRLHEKGRKMHQEERNSGQKKPAHPRRSVQDNQYEKRT
ncbi:MAG: hypothetical protein E7I02_08590, partial [Klebsiella grimontii]|nr:hypothetical protein [Klebsiella grimontii]